MFDISLKDGFLDRLAKLPWWRDILAYRDPDTGHPFFVAVRKDYLSVYFLGKAIFKKVYEDRTGAIVARVDRRYFDGPGAPSGDLVFDGVTLGGPAGRPYSGAADMAAWAKTVKTYRPAKPDALGEKECLAPYALEPFVINLEMALPGFQGDVSRASKAASLPKKVQSTAPRIDMVELRRQNDKVQVVFTEAKLFSNKELRAAPGGDAAKIFGQMKKYEEYITLHETTIRQSYHRACKYLIDIRKTQGVPVHPFLIDAAASADNIALEKKPRLLIFRTPKDKNMSKQHWTPHFDKLQKVAMCKVVDWAG